MTSTAREPRSNGQWAVDGHTPLNHNEEFKAVDDPLTVRQRVEQVYAMQGFDAIPADDLHGRLRWWGLYTQRRQDIDASRTASLGPDELSDRYFMMRVRTDGQILDGPALRALGACSTAYGRDTAGALVFLPAGEGPEDRVGAVELMADTDIAMHAHQHIVGLGSAGRVCRPASMAGPRGRPAGPGRARSPCHVALAADFNSRHTKGAAHRGSCPPCGNRPSGLSGSGPRQGKPAPLPPAHRKVHDA